MSCQSQWSSFVMMHFYFIWLHDVIFKVVFLRENTIVLFLYKRGSPESTTWSFLSKVMSDGPVFVVFLHSFICLFLDLVVKHEKQKRRSVSSWETVFSFSGNWTQESRNVIQKQTQEQEVGLPSFISISLTMSWFGITWSLLQWILERHDVLMLLSMLSRLLLSCFLFLHTNSLFLFLSSLFVLTISFEVEGVTYSFSATGTSSNLILKSSGSEDQAATRIWWREYTQNPV